MTSRYTYRAKRKDNQEWVYGLLIRKRDLTFNNEYDEFYAIQDDFFEEYRIDEQTLSQCTGLQDIEGNYIFENDIIENIFGDDIQILDCIWWDTGLYFEDRKDYSYRCLTNPKIIGNKFDSEV